jgi:hypothetical protein
MLSWSTSSVSTMLQISTSWYHSRVLRAKRDTSRAATAPTSPRPTCATMRSNPGRTRVPLALRPRSSSITSTSRHPSSWSRDAIAYCRRWLSGL